MKFSASCKAADTAACSARLLSSDCAHDASCTAAAILQTPAASKGVRNADAVPIWAREESPVARRALQQSSTARALLQSNALTCDGTERTIILPTAVDPYTLPSGLSCGRPNGGSCAGQDAITCKPFTDNNGQIGPITFGNQPGQAPLLVNPNNPLVFTLSPGLFLTYVGWRVYDVGTGGARLVGKYPAGSTIAADKDEHEWTLPPGPIDGDGNCDACTNCTVGFGIQDLRVTSRPGTGYSSFELSQIYEAPTCGKSCFDLDGSYWTGMTYTCVQVRGCQSSVQG
jgi:hypothetical protein